MEGSPDIGSFQSSPGDSNGPQSLGATERWHFFLKPQLGLPDGQQPLGRVCSDTGWPFDSSELLAELIILACALGSVSYSERITLTALTASLPTGPVQRGSGGGEMVLGPSLLEETNRWGMGARMGQTQGCDASSPGTLPAALHILAGQE